MLDTTSDGADVAAWLRLTLPGGPSPATVRRLLAAFGLPRQVFTQSLARLSELVPAHVAHALLASPDERLRALVERTQAWLAVPGNYLLTLADRAYPRTLLDLADPPPVLYVKGNLAVLGNAALAMVGARSATLQGTLDAEAFAGEFSHAGLTVVSGLALGIDAAAHAGGLRGPASTIAVIGTGVDLVYPARNRALAHRIAGHGAIVSEFPLGTRPRTHHFPRRNRLIAALSRGVFVVEAAARSGSLITARFAAELGREVFAMPGSIHAPLAKGCHQLIRTGAKLVESAQDILEELGQLGTAPRAAPRHMPVLPEAPARSHDGPMPLACPSPRQAHPSGRAASGPVADPLGDALGWDPVGIEALCSRSGLSPQAVSAALLALEMADQAERMPGNRYRRLRVHGAELTEPLQSTGNSA